MKDFKDGYQAGYDESSILWEYRKSTNDQILKSSLYGMIAIIVVTSYFIYSDNYFRNIGFLTPWRILPILMALAVLVLRKTFLMENVIVMFIAYNLALFLCSFMMAGIMFSLFGTDFFKASINGTVVAGFLIYVGTIGGVRILFMNYLPIFISLIAIYLTHRPPMTIMAEYGNVGVLVIACLIISEIQERLRFTEFRSGKISEIEKNKSNSLLLNILPSDAVEELKITGRVTARKIENATVLFSDFKNFTAKAEQIEPEKLVKSIDFYFRFFDTIIEKYQIEKIKTIGDAYMCVGGLDNSSFPHEHGVCKAAIEMLRFVNVEARKNQEVEHFDVRIGIHSGSVIAGIVGLKKFQYDIWGDSVNIASRMESAAEVGSINISDTTYDVIKNDFVCEDRGHIEIKNRGLRHMFFLISEKSAF